MPEISRFYGIVMYYRDHAPPHFHAEYAGDQAIIDLDSLAIIGGKLPPRAAGLVIEWASWHRDELRDDWERARQMQPLRKIDPLP